MKYETLSGGDNPKVREITRLRTSAKARRESGRFLLEGLRLCRDAAESGYRPLYTVFTEELLARHPEELGAVLHASRESFVVTERAAERLCDTVSPQGVFCVLSVPEPPVFAAKGQYIGLEGISDPGNLGTVARTAEALGLAGVALFGATCDPYSPKAQRAAMGSLLRLPVHTFDSVALFRERYPAVKIYAAVARGGISPEEADFTPPAMTLIGGEANGLSGGTVSLCDAALTIPMPGRAESMNAAAAASILIWEMTRRGR